MMFTINDHHYYINSLLKHLLALFCWILIIVEQCMYLFSIESTRLSPREMENSIFHVIKMFFHCTHYLYNIISKLDESLVSSYILFCIIDFKNVNSHFLTGHFNYLMSKTLIQTWIILICLRHPKAVFTLRT
jgi:hypothetical protein